MTTSGRRSAELRAALAGQSGMASRRQLHALGVTDKAIAANIAAGRWSRPATHVVGLQTGRPTPIQLLGVAVLDGGEECSLGGLSALHAAGLKGFPVERIQTVVPADKAGRRTDLYVRRRAAVAAADLNLLGRPPRLTTPAALVDALRHIGPPRRGCALMAAVVQQRLLRSGQLRPLIEATPTLPHRAVYLLVAGDIDGGAHSLAEIDFGRIAMSAGLPAPARQTIRIDSTGRRRYLDAEFDGFVVEVDGAVHLQPAKWWDDMWRQNDIVLGGSPVLRFASAFLRLEPERVRAQLRQAHARFGRPGASLQQLLPREG